MKPEKFEINNVHELAKVVSYYLKVTHMFIHKKTIVVNLEISNKKCFLLLFVHNATATRVHI